MIGARIGCISVRQVSPLCEKPLRVYIPRPLLPRRAKGSLQSEMHPVTVADRFCFHARIRPKSAMFFASLRRPAEYFQGLSQPFGVM